MVEDRREKVTKSFLLQHSGADTFGASVYILGYHMTISELCG